MGAKDRWLSAYHLQEQAFAGVEDPANMGTTGLVAWTIVGPGGYRRAWNRLAKAVKIVQRRRGSVDGFCHAIYEATPNRAQKERFRAYFDTLARRGLPITTRRRQ